MNESDVQEFWQHHPCGDMQVGGLADFRSDYESFFEKYDQFRYTKEAHILECLDRINFSGRHTLEIGLGQGADSEQLIKRGARWSGIDLTAESVERVRVRMALRDLQYESLQQGSVLALPYEDDSFDIVFSHGVLHHVPDIHTAQQEIARVLRPNGLLIAMLYARYSLNYLVSIALVRRLGLLVCYLLPIGRSSELLAAHVANAKACGLVNYLKMTTFLHRNTDGPLNPYSKVYDKRLIRRDFCDFNITRLYKVFMHAPPLPVRHVPLGKCLGWHLWAHMEPRQSGVNRASQHA